MLEQFRLMCQIRIFEENCARLYKAGEIPGFVHLSIGQEASAVGACTALRPTDGIVSNHRGHGHCIAKGLSVESMFLELMARDEGACAGRGGSMHIADPTLGIYGANGIVGAGIAIANGPAVAARLRGEDNITLVFFGDGAVAQGSFHEAVNIAALWKLPVIFYCENNHYAEFSAAADQHPVGLSARAGAYGIPFFSLDGNDVTAVHDGMRGIVDMVRGGAGPVLVEAETYRWHGHYEGDPERYRSKEEGAEWRERDPLERARRTLREAGCSAEELDAIAAEQEREVTAAIEHARRAPAPAGSSLHEHVVRAHASHPEPQDRVGSEDFRMMDAVRLALEAEMEDDPEVFMAGIDIAAGGNVFGITRGLHERWPARVLDTPISENAMLGLGVGAAMAGMKPVLEVMYMDFITVCFDQVVNQAAKLSFMTGGKAQMNLTIRTQFGAGRSSGSQHSQSLEALLAHIPGITVVMPSNPWDAYGLLRSAIQDPNPVVFIENRMEYGRKGPKPPRDTCIPIGRARIAREGSGVTVVSYSRMFNTCATVVDELVEEGIDVELIDLRTIAPLDWDTIHASLVKTNRLVVVHEAVRDFGIGAEIVARMADEGFWSLDAPMVRVGSAFTPAPYAPNLEQAWLPDRERIAEAIRKVANA
ncbi:dehydrogenase E1 component subunit alpha/beta [Nocardioides sp.]|uniref:alpha-ketoacid dehydrogenase subunit alpha/beta n=1 Tax=Nocardioides sp. TaxID=35761 RepID=UPI002638B552|nr:dehydrogenase E1 component subunit alpha/beta [Nocardioides sp.]MDI6912314.1 dehydrogenase E1 component subunit alpha/beta [Nocardioides sp.]